MFTRKSFQNSFLEKIQAPEITCRFLTQALEESSSPHHLKFALRDAIRVYGLENIARKTGLRRQSIQKMFSEIGNPTHKNLVIILGALGLELTVKPIKTHSND